MANRLGQEVRPVAEIILTCPTVNLSAALQALAVPASAVMFLERVPSRWLEEDEVADGIRLAAYDGRTTWGVWERGRVFCDAWELRWEGVQASYTGPVATLPGFGPGPDLAGCKRRETVYYLWGSRDRDRFLELQVARVLTYPVQGAAARLQLRVAEWLGPSGELLAWRCVGLKEAL
jgi:hypothetical protein